MTVYIGVDFHARQQTISYLTTEDGEIKRLQLDHGQPEEVRRFYRQFAGQQVVVGFESSGRAAWFEELLEELGCEIWIGHKNKKWGQACDLRFYLTVVGVAEWRRLEFAGAMARKARAEVEGGLYHVITRGNNRQTIFKCKDDFQKFL